MFVLFVLLFRLPMFNVFFVYNKLCFCVLLSLLFVCVHVFFCYSLFFLNLLCFHSLLFMQCIVLFVSYFGYVFLHCLDCCRLYVFLLYVVRFLSLYLFSCVSGICLFYLCVFCFLLFSCVVFYYSPGVFIFSVVLPFLHCLNVFCNLGIVF